MVGDDHARLVTNQIGRQCRQSVVLLVGRQYSIATFLPSAKPWPRDRNAASSHATTNTKSLKIEERPLDRSAALGYRQRQHTGRPTKPHRRAFQHSPAVGPNLNCTPVLIGEIKIDAARMLRDADADHPLGSIKLRARLK